MKIRQREKIYKAWLSGNRRKWKKSTLMEASKPYDIPTKDGGYRIPRFLVPALLRLFR